MSATMILALSGLCQMCGSPPAISWSPGSPRRRLTPRLVSTTGPVKPADSTVCSSHFSRPTPFSTTTLAAPMAWMSAGVGSYSCGSTLGLMIWVTATSAPPMLRTKSATSGVVATTARAPEEEAAADWPAEAHPASAIRAAAEARTGRRDEGFTSENGNGFQKQLSNGELTMCSVPYCMVIRISASPHQLVGRHSATPRVRRVFGSGGVQVENVPDEVGFAGGPPE